MAIELLSFTCPGAKTPRPITLVVALGGAVETTLTAAWSPPAVTDPAPTEQFTVVAAVAVLGTSDPATRSAAVVVPITLITTDHHLHLARWSKRPFGCDLGFMTLTDRSVND